MPIETCVYCYNKKSPAEGLGILNGAQSILLWRRRWDSNPRDAHHAKTISSRSRYDHFDTSPYK